MEPRSLASCSKFPTRDAVVREGVELPQNIGTNLRGDVGRTASLPVMSKPNPLLNETRSRATLARVVLRIDKRRIWHITASLLAVAMIVFSTAERTSATPQPPASAAALLDLVVTDPDGAAIQNATVTLTNQLTNETIAQKSSDRGLARFLEIPAATYTVGVEAVGFETVKQTNVKLLVGQASGMEIRLFVREQRIQSPMGVIFRRQVLTPLSSLRGPWLPLEALAPPEQPSPKSSNP